MGPVQYFGRSNFDQIAHLLYTFVKFFLTLIPGLIFINIWRVCTDNYAEERKLICHYLNIKLGYRFREIAC